MSIDEELQEHAEHAREPFDKKVAASMAIIAAALAVVSVLGHMYTTEELRFQTKTADEYAHRQAQRIRAYEAHATADLLKALHAPLADYQKDEKHFQEDADSTLDKAHEFERETSLAERRAFRLHIGEVFLEIAIVLASLAILSKRSVMWYAGLMSGAAGAVIAITTTLIR